MRPRVSQAVAVLLIATGCLDLSSDGKTFACPGCADGGDGGGDAGTADAGRSCDSGECSAACGPQTCSGCCNGNTCVPLNSETPALCGEGPQAPGAACVSCSAGNICGGNACAPVQAITGGDFHSCALVGGAVWCWGSNSNGQLGNGTTTDSAFPVPPSGEMAAGGSEVSAGAGHTCGVIGNGAFCWGTGAWGRLGNGTGTDSPVPVPVSGLGPDSGVHALSAGGSHTCALDSVGRVWCWGSNADGELGTTAVANALVPVEVDMSTMPPAQSVAAGYWFTCALDVQGEVWCWGAANAGQLGIGLGADGGAPPNAYSPQRVPTLSQAVVALAAGGTHACAVTADGAAWCWGLNSNGQLGDGTTIDRYSPVAVYGLRGGVQGITAGFAHTCARVDGGVECWGANAEDELGNGTTVDSAVPVPVTGLAAGVTRISAGGKHTCAVEEGLKCWGYNGWGALGDGSLDPSGSPVPVGPWP